MEKELLSSGNGKLKETWESGSINYKHYDKDYPYGYPWPPRYYTCSFCQREFKSAQALGGHMNIHRRDRARLRDQSPSNNPLYANDNSPDQGRLSPCPNTNPNPNFPSPSCSLQNTNFYAHQYSLVSLSLSSLPPSATNEGKCGNSSLESYCDHRVGTWKEFSLFGDHSCHHHEVKVYKSSSTSTKEVVKLDLELCLGEAKEELDLELRLGI